LGEKPKEIKSQQLIAIYIVIKRISIKTKFKRSMCEEARKVERERNLA
jgi:hypothetical protein